MKNNIVAIVPAAGAGSRMGDALPKQYLSLNGVPMICHTLTALAAVRRISKIVVVLSPNDKLFAAHAATCHASEHWSGKVEARQIGGETRAASVTAGLASLRAEVADGDWVLVHDAARPCIRAELIDQFIDELIDDPVGGLLALPVADTLKRSTEDHRVGETVSRENLWRAQTPQMFRYTDLCSALVRFPGGTDEAQSIESLGLRPRLVIGESANLKVTYATDLTLAQMLLTTHSARHAVNALAEHGKESVA